MRVGLTDFIPEQFALARKACGLSAIELAEQSGVSATTLSNWENGVQLPSYANLEKVANVLDFPINWFLNKIDVQDKGSYLYRNQKQNLNVFRETAKAQMKIVSQIVARLDEWVEFAPLNLPDVDVPKDFNLLDDLEIERIAAECREYWQLSSAPIPNMIELLEYIGVIVIKNKLGTTSMDGVSDWFDDKPFVFLANDKENAPRSRFDAAHELGHIILHRNVSAEDYDITSTKLTKEEKETRQRNYDLIEKQANLFAAAFLLPETMAYQLLPYPTLDNLLAIKKNWGVSVGALIMRGGSLGLISDEQKTRLFKNYSARGWRKGEPLDNTVKIEHPNMLYNAFDVLVQESGYPKEGLVELFGINESKLIDYCGLPDDFFNETSKVIKFKPRNR